MSKISVLVADDDSHMMQYYHAILDKADDIRMVAATTVCSRVLFLVQEMTPDIVLIDYAMIPIDGFQLMANIHAEFPETPVILLGGRKHLRSSAIEKGAADYLPVPITPRNLIDAIQRIGKKKPL
ncbi:MAG: response regulator [Anaerolineae bacterium]|nr:response regulator [Anaerolineae bacterium]